MECLKCELRGNYAVLQLDRPEALNSLNSETLVELDQIISELEQDNKMRAVVITSSTERAFVAGADISSMQKMSPSDLALFCQQGKDVFNKIANSNLISIAAVNGFALGGGFELALACKIRLAHETAVFALPELSLGMIPGFGGTQRLPRLVGEGLALELILTGERITAQRAYDLAVVNRIYSGDSFAKDISLFVEKLLSKNSKSAQLAALSAVSQGMEVSLEAGLKIEQSQVEKIAKTPDVQEGFQSFLEKRQPKFST